MGRPGRKRSRGIETQTAAKEARAARQAEVTSGRVEPGKDAGITVAAWLDRWLDQRRDPHGEREPLRPSTANGYQRIIEFYLRPEMARLKLRDLRASHAETIYRKMRARGVSEGTVGNVHAVLRAATKEAVRQRVIAHDPMASVVRRKVQRKPKVEWTVDEWHTFAAGATEERLWPCWLLAADGGLRRGELAGLRSEDVDLDAGVVTVARARVQVGADVHDGKPKSDAGTDRAVHLTTTTVDALRALRRTQAEERLAWGEAHKRTNLVFVMEDGSPWQPSSITQAFQRRVKALKLPMIRLHDLRHLSAALGIAAGETLLSVSTRLGHSDPMFTAKVYAHLFDPMKAADATRRGALLARPSTDLASGGSEG